MYIYAGDLGDAHDDPVRLPRDFYGIVVLPWDFHGTPMGLPCGTSMRLSWDPYGTPWDSHWTSTKLPCDFK